MKNHMIKDWKTRRNYAEFLTFDWNDERGKKKADCKQTNRKDTLQAPQKQTKSETVVWKEKQNKK